MAVTVVGKITDFYVGETKQFAITIKIDGVAQDIRSDTVTFRMKSSKSDTDANSVIEKVAGALSENGVASFTLTTTDTEVDVGPYYCDIEWILSGGEEYIVYDGTVNAKERVSDA